jgi:hypothetical protein
VTTLATKKTKLEIAAYDHFPIIGWKNLEILSSIFGNRLNSIIPKLNYEHASQIPGNWLK